MSSRGIEHALVSFGESSIIAIGAEPGASAWQIGIGDRVDATRSVGGFALRDAAMSTSGAARGMPHLIDPHTRQAVGIDRQLSIACTCPVDAEVLSTALIATPVAERPQILRRYPPARAIEFAWRAEGAHGSEERIWSHAA